MAGPCPHKAQSQVRCTGAVVRVEFSGRILRECCVEALALMTATSDASGTPSFSSHKWRKLDPEEYERCRAMINVAGSLSGFQWQAFVPSLPLMLVQGLHRRPSSIGTRTLPAPTASTCEKSVLYRVILLAATCCCQSQLSAATRLTAAHALSGSPDLVSALTHAASIGANLAVYLVFILLSTLSYLALQWLLGFTSAYTLLHRAFEVRMASGLLHVAALSLMHTPDASMGLLLVSRALHGATLLLVPLAVVWIGTHAPDKSKPAALAERNMHSAAGITFGLFAGALLMSALPDPIAAGAAPGWLLFVSSALMWVWLRGDVHVCGVSLPAWAWSSPGFTDTQLLPQKAPPRKPSILKTEDGIRGDNLADDEEGDGVPWLHIVLVGASNFSGWAGYLVIEGTLSLVLVQGFGLPSSLVMLGWLPTAIAIFTGTFFFSRLIQAGWPTTDLVWVVAAVMAVGLLCTLLLTAGLAGAPDGEMAIATYVVGASATLFGFGFSNTLINAQLLLWLPIHMQARFQMPVQLLASLGRALGPSLGALIIESDRRRRSALVDGASAASITVGPQQPPGGRLHWAYDNQVFLAAWGLVALAAFVPGAFGPWRDARPPILMCLRSVSTRPLLLWCGTGLLALAFLHGPSCTGLLALAFLLSPFFVQSQPRRAPFVVWLVCTQRLSETASWRSPFQRTRTKSPPRAMPHRPRTP